MLFEATDVLNIFFAVRLTLYVLNRRFFLSRYEAKILAAKEELLKNTKEEKKTTFENNHEEPKTAADENKEETKDPKNESRIEVSSAADDNVLRNRKLSTLSALSTTASIGGAWKH